MNSTFFKTVPATVNMQIRWFMRIVFMAEYPKLHVMFFETGLESVEIVQKSRMLLFTGNFTYFS